MLEDAMTLRAVPRAYISLVGVMSIPLMLSLILVIKRLFVSADLSNVFPFVFYSALIPSFWVMWLASFRIDVDSTSVSYRRPFFRRTTLRWPEVASVEVKEVLRKRAATVASPFAAIFITARDGKRSIVINTRPFSFQELKASLAFMKSRIGTPDP